MVEWAGAGGGSGAEEEEEEEAAAAVVVSAAYYDYLGGINKTKQQTVERWYRV